jgi:hypothetical protein
VWDDKRGLKLRRKEKFKVLCTYGNSSFFKFGMTSDPEGEKCYEIQASKIKFYTSGKYKST